jgi:hypothetical protein
MEIKIIRKLSQIRLVREECSRIIESQKYFEK